MFMLRAGDSPERMAVVCKLGVFISAELSIEKRAPPVQVLAQWPEQADRASIVSFSDQDRSLLL